LPNQRLLDKRLPNQRLLDKRLPNQRLLDRRYLDQMFLLTKNYVLLKKDSKFKKFISQQLWKLNSQFFSYCVQITWKPLPFPGTCTTLKLTWGRSSLTFSLTSPNVWPLPKKLPHSNPGEGGKTLVPADMFWNRFCWNYFQ